MRQINVDLNIHFWAGVLIFAAGGISNGTVHLTHMIPEVAIPTVIAWSSFISWLGSGYLTGALLLHNASPQAKLDAAAALPEVRGIVTTPALATDTVSNKVVATVSDLPKG